MICWSFVFLSSLISISAFVDRIFSTAELSNFQNAALHPSKILFSSGHLIDTTSPAALAHEAFLCSLTHDDETFSQLRTDSTRSQKFSENNRTWLILQVFPPNDEHTRSKIEKELGHPISHYLPHHAYAMLVPVNELRHLAIRARAMSEVSWVGAHLKAFKLLQSLDFASKNSVALGEEKRQIFFQQKSSGKLRISQWPGIAIVLGSESYQSFAPHAAQSEHAISQESLQATAERMVHDLHNALPNVHVDAVLAVSASRIDFVLLDSVDVQPVSQYLANFPAVFIVMPRTQMNLLNKWARPLMQTGDFQENGSTSFNLQNLSGAGEVIGIADTGIDTKSCFFYDDDYFRRCNQTAPFVPYKANSARPPDSLALSHRKIVQYITFFDDADDFLQGHGTHVSASLAGNISPYATNKSADLPLFNGMAPDAKIAFLDCGDAFGNFAIPDSIYTDILGAAYIAGARIHSDSWGASTLDNSYSIDAFVFDVFVWNHRDFLPILAAGNDGANGFRTVVTPSTAKNVISVGASMSNYNSFKQASCPGGYLPSLSQCPIDANIESNPFFSQNNMAYFSAMGPTSDGRIKPDIVAVGFQVLSARSSSNSSCPTDYKTGLRALQGTSMSTPILAGHAALVRQYYRQGRWLTGAVNESIGFAPSAALVKATILASGSALTGSRDLGCCKVSVLILICESAQCFSSAFTQSSALSRQYNFVTPYPDPQLGKCCCFDLDCTRRVLLPPSLEYLQMPAQIPNPIEGYGRPILENVLPASNASFSLIPLSRSKYDKIDFGDALINSSQVVETAVCVSNVTTAQQETFKVTLVWSDYPGTPAALLALVNNLDLFIIPPNATGLWGNGAYDSVNNNEQISINTSAFQKNSPYIIRVLGSNIPMGPQPFALIAVGPVYLASGSPGNWSCSADNHPLFSMTTVNRAVEATPSPVTSSADKKMFATFLIRPILFLVYPFCFCLLLTF